MTNAVVDHCRACGSKDLTPLFSLGNQFVSNFVPEAEAKAGYPNCPKCPLDLELCRACTCVQLKHSAPSELLYSRKYWFKSSGSNGNREALKDVVQAAMREVPLSTGDVVLDIGSNDGTLLRYYPDSVVRVGVEPADNLATKKNYSGLHLVHDFWSVDAWQTKGPWRFIDPKAKNLSVLDKPKIITALGMLYDSEDPSQFIGDVSKVLHPDGVFIAQLMCLRQTVNNRDVGNYAHEHLMFYSLRSLVDLYTRDGLHIYKVEENAVNGGSYRLYAYKMGGAVQLDDGSLNKYLLLERRDGLDLPSTLLSHYYEMHRNMAAVKAHLLKEKAARKSIWVRGASTKGNTILQFAGIDSTLVDAAADMDASKIGLYTVGTGIPIRTVEAMRAFKPDVVVILPYSFATEIVEAEKDQAWRQRGGKFLVCLPEMRVL